MSEVKISKFRILPQPCVTCRQLPHISFWDCFARANSNGNLPQWKQICQTDAGEKYVDDDGWQKWAVDCAAGQNTNDFICDTCLENMNKREIPLRCCRCNKQSNESTPCGDQNTSVNEKGIFGGYGSPVEDQECLWMDETSFAKSEVNLSLGNNICDHCVRYLKEHSLVDSGTDVIASFLRNQQTTFNP